MKFNLLNKSTKNIVLLISGVLVVHQAHSLTIDEYMNLSRQKNPLLQSLEITVESQKIKKDSAELDYSPLLTGSYLTSEDKSLPSQMGNDRKLQSYSLGIAKKFSTGTSVKLEAQTLDFQNPGAMLPSYVDYSTGALVLTVQQSLWKDFFGEGTRTKVSRLQKQNDLETMAADLQLRGALIESEVLFLDYAVALEDVKLKKANLDRAKKIDQWTTTRVNNGISDRADLMNAKALVALREVQLISAEEEVKSQEVKFRDSLQLSADEKTPVINVNLNATRPYLNQLLSQSQKNQKITKIESQMALIESSLKRDVAFEVEDSLKPELNLIAKYATTSNENNPSKALSELSSTDYPQSQLGLTLSWVFETDAKSSLRLSAQKDYRASQLKAEKKNTDGLSAWSDLKRKYEVLKKSLSTLEKVAEFQRERAKAEQDKLTKGRTVTANVVTAETDSAEAEINLLKTRSQLRKLETSALIFTVVQE